MTNTLNNQTYTLFTLFREYDVILIPSLQRSYAHGRLDDNATEVRTKFLTDLHETLEKVDGSRSLDLVYGEGRRSDGKKIFTLLDGQQRLTTLFLLHCFFAGVSKGNISWMKTEGEPKFRYKTRDSSSDFCALLADEDILYGFSNLVPARGESVCPISVSNYLRDSRRFLWTWQFDPTIQSMLVMLDAIQEEFRLHAREWVANKYIALTDPEQRIIFFDSYELNDTLPPDIQYIRMNQRGLRLTDYENFKASLLGFFKTLKTKPEKFDLKEFSRKLDNDWIDYFWKRSKDSPEKDAAIFDRQILLLLRATMEYYYAMSPQCNSTRSNNDKILDLLTDRNVPLTFFSLKKGGLFQNVDDTHIWNILTGFRDLMELLLKIKNEGLFSDFIDIIEKKISILLDSKRDQFSFAEQINFYAVFYYLVTYQSQPQDVTLHFPDWYRIISSITKYSDYSHQSQMVSSLNAVRRFLTEKLIDFSNFMKSNPRYPYGESSGFHQTQWLEEYIKENLRISEKWKKEIVQAEELYESQIILILEYAGIFSTDKKYDSTNVFCFPTDEQLNDFIYYRDAVSEFCSIWYETVFPRQALAICDILRRKEGDAQVYPFCGSQWSFNDNPWNHLKIDISRNTDKPFRILLKVFLDQMRFYKQESLQEKIEAYVKENVKNHRDRIREVDYSGFILNSDVIAFMGANLYYKTHINGEVFLIPDGKAYWRNDFFEYHLFLLKEVLEPQARVNGTSISIKTGSRDDDRWPHLELKNPDVEIYYDGNGIGYRIVDSVNEPHHVQNIDDVCKYFWENGVCNYE